MPSTHQPTLLLVDDEDNILAALQRLLRREAYRIVLSHGPEQALELIAELKRKGEPVDVILSDQRMPTMSGVEFLRRIRDDYPETVRLVLSGYTDLQSVTDAINEGAIYKFLTKPWDDENLKANLREAFQRKAMRDENQRLTHELAEANARLTEANDELHKLLEDKKLQNQMIESALDATQEVIQLIPWPIVGVDDGGMIAMANSAAESQFGRGDSLLGIPVARALPAELTALLSNPPGRPETTLLDGQPYRVVCRTMGLRSQSHGLLLALLPGDTPR